MGGPERDTYSLRPDLFQLFQKVKSPRLIARLDPGPQDGVKPDIAAPKLLLQTTNALGRGDRASSTVFLHRVVYALLQALLQKKNRSK